MLCAVAEVRNRYGDLGLSLGAPLLVGLFVEAEIEGRTLVYAYLLPWHALRQGSQLLVVNGEDRVSFREVEVLRARGKWAVVQGSLQ
ncbi:hypothetical protein [Nitrosococcus watsonii]|uniref:hypothetical protein n=1 Tax=Nitrosococcus watsonii TaxID=473531 RepID=UPI0003198289|nr:hypothetical protein [Nitrosococcus watsonii]